MNKRYNWVLTGTEGQPIRLVFSDAHGPVISEKELYPTVDQEGLAALKEEITQYGHERGLTDLEVGSYNAYMHRYA